MNELNKNKSFFILVTPIVVIIFLFSYVPFIYAFFLSLTKIDTNTGNTVFVGLEHFLDLFKDSEFLGSFEATLKYLVYFIVAMVLGGFFIALGINALPSYGTIYLVILFIPWVTSETVTASLWKWMLNSDYGIFDYIFQLPIHELLKNPNYALIGVTIASFWKTAAFSTIILLAALKGIPNQIYESASIDGANAFYKMIYITIPLLTKTFMVLVVYFGLNALQQAGIILVLTNGGPIGSTQTLGLLMYKSAFERFNLNYAAAISICLLAINLFLGLCLFISRKKLIRV